MTSKLVTSESNLFSGTGVIIEFRSTNYLVAIILNVFHNIPSNWSIQLFHGPSNYEFVINSRSLSHFIITRRLILTRLPEYTQANQGRHAYLNHILTNTSFWELVINVEKILFFQLDTTFCSNSPYKLSDFLEWDYIGAPWPYSWTNMTGGSLVGNGGFSLRSRSKTLVLIKTIPYNKSIYEDLYFGKYMPLVGGKVAPLEIAKKFSSEGQHYVNSMAIHKPFGDNYGQICQLCPEANLIPPFCRHQRSPYEFSA
ncbi:unnamed protein product [Rotaria sordida]|uniref:DUF5672 domain-containing protein n=1 Tax=Rotaria sordida TaxID=392033 RepID=A0A816A958_9BILA|nr:unnamed protein product [Rotaria sordida]CAF1593047.1 unnamed protein product [Rotaria sordida]